MRDYSPTKSSRLCAPPITPPSDNSEEEADMSRSSTESSPIASDEGRDDDRLTGNLESHSFDTDHTPPTSPINEKTRSMPPSQTITSIHPYPRAPSSTSVATPINPSTRQPRPRSLAPLSNLNTLPSPPKSPSLPKSQPVSRALFARLANDVPHAGLISSGKKKGGVQKMIVPTKGFRTTFELDLTASELARR